MSSGAGKLQTQEPQCRNSWIVGTPVRPLLQSGSWLSPKCSCTEGWSPECCYWEMVGTLNTSLGADFWWGLWDSGLLPTCFYLMSVRWTILPHYTHTHSVCVSAWPWTPREQGQGMIGQNIWDSEPKYTFFPWSLAVWRFATVIQSGLTAAPPLSSWSFTITSLSSILSGSQDSHISISTGIRTSQVPP